jgi:hypothetical protein
MTDEQLILALRRLARETSPTPSPEFADRLFDRLVSPVKLRRSPLGMRREMLILAAVLTLAAVGLAIAAGMRLPQPLPVVDANPSQPPAAGDVWTFRTDPAGTPIRIAYRLPDGIAIIVQEDPRFLTFTVGQRSYGFAPDQAGGPGGRGIRIIDVRTAKPHFNSDQPMGVDAASFMRGLQSGLKAGGPLGPVSAGQVGGLPALVGDLGPSAARVHMDAGDIWVDLWPPSRLIVLDVDGAIVMVQVWADSQATLTSWLEESRPLVDSLTITVATEVAPT